MDVACFRILVVDDHVYTANLLARVLQRQGWHVETARSVAEAIRKAAAEPFDVLLCDLSLPDGDACDVLIHLQSQSIDSRTPPAFRPTAIALTGHAFPQDWARSRLAGFAHHVVKPVDLKHLIQLVADHCSVSQNC